MNERQPRTILRRELLQNLGKIAAGGVVFGPTLLGVAGCDRSSPDVPPTCDPNQEKREIKRDYTLLINSFDMQTLFGDNEAERKQAWVQPKEEITKWEKESPEDTIFVVGVNVSFNEAYSKEQAQKEVERLLAIASNELGLPKGDGMSGTYREDRPGAEPTLHVYALGKKEKGTDPNCAA